MPLNNLEDSEELKGLNWMVATSQALGIAMVIMLGVWLGKDLGGFAWDGTSKEFNIHPLSMVCGLIFLYGESAILYRVFRNSEKFKVKIIHCVLMILALVVAIIGLVAVFQFHNNYHIKNMYSLHSWCGIITVLLFCFQLLFGFSAFLFPGVHENLRAYYLPIHRFFGTAILMLGVVTSISGINEKLFFVLSKSYQNLPSTAVLGNTIGIVIIAYVVSILYILYRPEWKRKPQETDQYDSIMAETQN